MKSIVKLQGSRYYCSFEMMKLIRFLAFFIASSLVIRESAETLIKNLINSQGNLTYVVNDAVQYGGIALCVVGLSIFLKRNIWAYLFLLVTIASFFPILDFVSFGMTISLFSLTINVIPFSILVLHVVLNIHLIRIPELSNEQEEASKNEQVEFYKKHLAKKSDEELARMDEKEMLPEAIEARKILLAERSL